VARPLILRPPPNMWSVTYRVFGYLATAIGVSVTSTGLLECPGVTHFTDPRYVSFRCFFWDVTDRRSKSIRQHHLTTCSNNVLSSRCENLTPIPFPKWNFDNFFFHLGLFHVRIHWRILGMKTMRSCPRSSKCEMYSRRAHVILKVRLFPVVLCCF
jgi:hypothetical protein